MTLSLKPLVAGLLVVSACTLEVTDETFSPLTYPSAPIKVHVRSSAGIDRVDVIVPGFGSTPMSATGSNRYEADLPIEVCSEIGEFEVDVTTRAIGSSRMDRFPEVGRFTHPVTGLPDECEDFSQEASQTFTVDRVEDFPDEAPGDGICRGTVDDISGCSLRAAVMEANARLGTDLIRVPVNRYVLSRTGSERDGRPDDKIGDLDIIDSVTIEGISGTNRAVWDFLMRSENDRRKNLRDDPSRNHVFVKVDGGRIDRVFQISGRRTAVRLRNLAVVNGRSNGLGGGILNAGLLSLERVAVTDNQMWGPDATGIGGGGIRNDGTLVANDVAITQNQVGSQVSNPTGGALFNTGTARIRRGLIAYNDARFGNAVHNHDEATITMENVTIHDHRWIGRPPVTVVRNNGRMDLAFVTFSQNRIGERILLSNGSAAGQLTLRNVLMIDNTAAPHCHRAMTSLGGNVTTDICRLTGSSDVLANDHIDVPASAFGGLDDLGGFTPVYPLSEFATRFNAIDKGYLPPFPFFDQRGEGFPRVVDGDGIARSDGRAEPDPGAYEFQNN